MLGAFLAICVLFQGDCFAQVSVRSPEEDTARAEPPPESCVSDSQCSMALLNPGQQASCIEARCVNAKCIHVKLVGKRLDGVRAPHPLSCYEAQLVCDERGFAVPSENESDFVAIRQGQACLAAAPNSNPCEKPVCRGMQCVFEANDGVACLDTAVPLAQCHKHECRNRECQAVADPRKKGLPCTDPKTGSTSKTSDCRTTDFQCDTAGACVGSTPRLAAGAECAAGPNELAPSVGLPDAFRSLVVSSASFPTYSCNTTLCKLEFCGDGAITGSEDCDGTRFKPGAPSTARCDAECKLQYCGDNHRSATEQCDGSDIPPTAPVGSRCNKQCVLERCGDGIRNGAEECDGNDAPPGMTCSAQCTLCGDTVVKAVDLCRTPQTVRQDFNPQQQIEYWLRELGFSTYQGAVITGHVNGVLFTYTNELGQKCWVDHEMYDGPAPGLGVCRDGNYEKFEFHCSSCTGNRTTCGERFGDKPGLKVMELGVQGDGNCISGAANAAYQRFKKDYPGYESVMTGEDLGYSPDRKGGYGHVEPNKPSWLNPRDMVTCEVCYWPVCGNGVRTPDEECDGTDLPANAPQGSTCSAQCKLEYCGDGKINNNGREQCDGSALPANVLPGSTCSASCQLQRQVSLASGSCTIEPEGATATSIFCRVGSLESWSEGKYRRPGNNAPTLENGVGLRDLEERALTSASNLCKGIDGPDSGYTGKKQAVLTGSDVALDRLGAPYGTVGFTCVQQAN